VNDPRAAFRPSMALAFIWLLFNAMMGGTGITTSLTVIVSGELLASDDVAISSVL